MGDRPGICGTFAMSPLGRLSCRRWLFDVEPNTPGMWRKSGRGRDLIDRLKEGLLALKRISAVAVIAMAPLALCFDASNGTVMTA
ncbi:hypothetical protein [Paraburkholderia kirstenboschensis]|uniref:hypothetical protein n=1 Tax=Paraburkholderia kirstenboschensis TaxID=1245436 RepID=UPI000FFBA2F1|nr:hypothetical protein [Paraburkholderia kirstenboschensis]